VDLPLREDDQIIADVLDAAARQDRVALVELLHSYLHWTEAGRTIRGRNNVFARLAAGPPPAPPGSYELRDARSTAGPRRRRRRDVDREGTKLPRLVYSAVRTWKLAFCR
jgi:hypothetical protein